MQRFTVLYPDGSKQKISAARRDELIISGAIREQSGRYFYTGQAQTFHALADLSKLSQSAPWDGRKYLPGQFIIEFGRKRFRERLETPEGLALRLA